MHGRAAWRAFRSVCQECGDESRETRDLRATDILYNNNNNNNDNNTKTMRGGGIIKYFVGFLRYHGGGYNLRRISRTYIVIIF